MGNNDDIRELMGKVDDLINRASPPIAPPLPPVSGHEGHHVNNFIPPKPSDIGLQNTVKEYPYYTDDMKYHYQKVILYSQVMQKAHDYAMAQKDALSPPEYDQFGKPIIAPGRYTFMTDDMMSAYKEMVKHADLLDKAFGTEAERPMNGATAASTFDGSDVSGAAGVSHGHDDQWPATHGANTGGDGHSIA